MASQTMNRSNLLVGSASLALALGLATAPGLAFAQAFQASPEVVFGNADIDRSITGLDTITANTRTVVIDWTPDELGGNALDFLPTNTTAIYQNNIDLIPDFAVLNRILPSQNGNIAVIDGRVISRVDPGNGFIPGGFVAFYSPTGILVGSNASFDLAGLMLTTLDPDIGSFANFGSGGGTLNLIGAAGSASRVQIDSGARIVASGDGSFFIVAAPQVIMNGVADINGSTAYVAGERVDLTFSDGLFDIVIPIGTGVATAIDHNGATGGPSSTGLGDNHVVYAVARAETNPIQMLFGGNLGFAPAAVAGIDNGDIILAANFDVFGRSVNGGSVDQGLAAIFPDNAQTSAVRADIAIDAFAATSDLMAVGTHATRASAEAGSSAVAGNLLLAGGEQALLTVANGNDFLVDGDVLVTATDYGLQSEGNFSPPLANAAGGRAEIIASTGGQIVVAGDVLASADAIAGFDQVFDVAGNAVAGTASIHGMGGGIGIGGSATVSAFARGPANAALISAGTATGGTARMIATLGGQVTVDQDFAAFAGALGADVSASSSQSGAAATGGLALLSVFSGGGAISIGGGAELNADATAGPGNGSAPGANGVAGEAAVTADAPGASIAIVGSVALGANGEGSVNAVGLGGSGIGGRSRMSALNGTITVTGVVDARAQGVGGSGLSGGAGTGGTAGIDFAGGTVQIAGNANLNAAGTGGDGTGGNGGAGVGGVANIATATATPGAAVIAGRAEIFANGIGGDALTAGSNGGPGVGGQAYILTQAGAVVQIGLAQVIASGQGGTGPAATGGDGTGGLAFIEARGSGSRVTITSAPIMGGNALDQGSVLAANGIGGNTTGGLGIGGTGTGGVVTALALNGGTVALPQDGGVEGQARMFARGEGGSSSVAGGAGGSAVGGTGTVAADGGTLTAARVHLSVFAQGGSSANAGLDIGGGSGAGGERTIRVSGGGVLTASFPSGVAGGAGGSASGSGRGGDGSGGVVSLEVDGGTANLTGTSVVSAQNTGGNGATGGDAAMGTATVLIDNGGVLNLVDGPFGPGRMVVGSLSTGGAGTTGDGGDAASQVARIIMTNGSINGGSIEVVADATGGASTTGMAGAATGGTAIFAATDGTIAAGTIRVSADARGGVGQTGTHGNAGAGAAQVVSGAELVVTGAITTFAVATSGAATPTSATGGTATGGDASMAFEGGATVQVGGILADAGAVALSSGDANAGTAKVDAFDAAVTTPDLRLRASANSTGGQSAQGGTTELSSRAGATIDATTVALETIASGSAANVAGSIAIDADAGDMTTGSLTAQAAGGPTGGAVSITADNGRIAVTGTADVLAVGDVTVEAVNGGLIGGPTIAAPTARIDISTPATIRFIGNNDNSISFGGDRVRLASSNLDIGAGSRIGATVMTIESTNISNTAVLGGTTQGAGYTLTAAEIARIEAGTVELSAPIVNEGDVDVLLRDLVLTGSLDDGTSDILLTTPGTIRVEGLVAYTDSQPGDRLSMEAGRRIEIVTPGGIAAVGSGDEPGGALSLRARDVWVADAATIAALRVDPNFAGRDDLLLSTAADSADPLGYLRAGQMQIAVGQSLLVRNTGSERQPGGILVGEGGLSINGRFEIGDSPALDVFAFGRQQTAQGGFVLGQAFYELVNFNRVGDAATDYLDSAELNECIINTGECRGFSEELIEAAPPVNNPVVVAGPIESVDTIPPTEDETNTSFGFDFPGMIEAPLLSQDPLVQDPVTSGGDSALYASDDEDAGGNGDED